MRPTWWSVLFACGILAAVAGPGPAAEDKDNEKKGTPVEIDGLKSPTPADWKEVEVSETAQRMGRLLQFRIPGADAKSDADLFVFYFKGKGGTAKDNINRWKTMFVPPEGKTIDDVTRIDNMKVGDVPVTEVDIHGTYKFKKAPFVPDSRAELKPNYRMIAVIFDSKNGPYYFRLVGPEKTVEEHKKEFDGWVKGFK